VLKEGRTNVAVYPSERIFGGYLGMDTKMAVTTADRIATKVDRPGEILEHASKIRRVKDHIYWSDKSFSEIR
jgi:hypothetical protein